MQYRLLEKTEIWITPLRLHDADLAACAHAAGEVLGLTPEQIMVTDAQKEHLVFDVLTPHGGSQADSSPQGCPAGRPWAGCRGVGIDQNTEIHSDGNPGHDQPGAG